MGIFSEFDLILFSSVFGLLIGSFLNVVIFRLPRIIEEDWKLQAKDILGLTETLEPSQNTGKFNLMTPRSRCGSCGHVLRWYENIPLLSFLILRGRCSACNAAISLRYPVIELTSALIAAYCALRWGITPAGILWYALLVSLLVLALIDWDTTLLPDSLTIPLLWLGIISAAARWTHVPVENAVWGSVLGYLSLWSVYWAFKLMTGKEGMGYGDFKLLGALGAWLGWHALIPIILIASIMGALVGLGMKATGQLRDGLYVPFGPFLSGAGAIVVLNGQGGILTPLGY